MEKSNFLLVVISFGLLFACVIEATEKNFKDETSHLLWPRKLFRGEADPPPTRGPHKAAIVDVKPWSPSQRLVFGMLPKNVPIPPSGPSRGGSPPLRPRTV
ncbi:hypothetical protein Bca52824_033477 [Brassica carinata]|uniref:Uncharacterized protein n=1 Tax=Brassica carinata TaxID=52824 RepID=A0A8X7SEA2_BRACI|nr:hypothetical protein Bca52824_033477 [Brassica carinata]